MKFSSRKKVRQKIHLLCREAFSTAHRLYNEFLFSYLAINPHIRYYNSSYKKISGYISADAGCLMYFREGKTYAGPDIAPETGFTVNFSKISLDSGVKAITLSY